MLLPLLLPLLLLASCGPVNGLPIPDDVRHPLLLFPGLGASQLDARINKTSSPHFFCHKQQDWFRLWLDPAYMLPKIIDCFFDNMRLVYNEETGRTENPSGVETRVAGYGSTRDVEYLTEQLGMKFRASMSLFLSPVFPPVFATCPSACLTMFLQSTAGYFNALVEALISLGYKRDVSIRGAPYDFRKSPRECCTQAAS